MKCKLVFGLQNGEVRLLDDETYIQKWLINEFDPATNHHNAYERGISLSTSIDGEYIAMVDRSREHWKIFNCNGTEVTNRDGNMGRLESIKLSPSNGLMAVISTQRRMKMFHARTYEELWELTPIRGDALPPSIAICCVSFTSDSTLVAVMSKYGNVQIRYAATGFAFKNLEINGVGEFCPKNNNFFSCTNGDDLALWDIMSEEKIWEINLGRDDFMGLQNFALFSPDGKTIATLQQDERVEISGSEQSSGEGSDEDYVPNVNGSLTPESRWDSNSVAESVSELGSSNDTEYTEADNIVVVVNANNGRRKFSLNHQRFTSIFDAAFSPNGLQLACVGTFHEMSGVCVLWNMVNGNAICCIHSYPEMRSVVWLVDQTARAVAMSRIARLNKVPEVANLGNLDVELLRKIDLEVEGPRIIRPDPPNRSGNDLDTINHYEI